MPLPISPDEIKDLVPSPTGNFCEKFQKSLKLPWVAHQVFSWMFNPDGTISDEFGADICALGCMGGGGTDTGSGLPSSILSASDGQFADKVQLTWTSVSGALTYDIYRNTVNNSSTAVRIVADLAGTVYDDASVSAGQYYYYWVRAKNATQTSAFSQGDRGHAGSISTSLAAITDLVASKGITLPATVESGGSGRIWLMWTPVTGAETYDIYRNSVDDFTSASLIDANRSPFDNSQNSNSQGPVPHLIDAGDLILYSHDPGNPTLNYFTKFYFWVKAKRSGPPAESLQSNSSQGWASGRGNGVLAMQQSSFRLSEELVPVGATKAWVVLVGAGGGGAGGSTAYGGGGGGGPAIIAGWKTGLVGGTSKFRLIFTPNSDTSNAAAGASGSNGPTTQLQYSANGTFSDAVTLASCAAAQGGSFNPAGGGVGGNGAAPTNVSLTENQEYTGVAGKPGVGTKGGRSGYVLGGFPQPGAHYNNYLAYGSWSGDGAANTPRTAGSGSYIGSGNDPTGGKGVRGHCLIVYYS